MSDFTDKLNGLNQDIISGVMIPVGLIFAFFGSKWFKYIIFFVGFVIGGLGTWFLMGDIATIFKFTISDQATLYISLGVGAALGFLLIALYKLSVFVTGAIFGVIISQLLWKVIISLEPDLPQQKVIQFGLITVFAIGFGLLAFYFVKQVLKIVTAFIGGFFFATAIAYFIERIAGDSNQGSTNIIDWVAFFSSSNTYQNGQVSAVCNGFCLLCIGLWVTVFAAGTSVQYKFHKGSDDDKDKDSDDDSSEESEDENGNRRRKRRKRRDSNSSESSESSNDDDINTKKSRNNKNFRREPENNGRTEMVATKSYENEGNYDKYV